MVSRLDWKVFKGWRIRIISFWRCLRRPHFILVSWKRCPDGDIDFKITHKGVELPEAIHRLKVDAVEILQDICDQDSALDEIDSILRDK